jgi:hypothetical protein
MSAREILERLAKPPARKEPQTRNRLARVEAHEVEVAAEPPVLEPVVEQEHVRAEPLEELSTDGGAVRPDGDGEAGNSACQLERLVA